MLPATMMNIKQAFKEIKHLGGEPWEGDYRPYARECLKQILEGRMHDQVEEHLERVRDQEIRDRRNGSYKRHFLTELGDLELQIPRTRTFNPVGILRRFARRLAHVERMILLAFVLGLSTRKVSQALLPILGEPVSAQTVSRVAKQLDAAVAAYHRRPLRDHYALLVLDGVILKHKTGAGAQKRTVLVALGIRPDGKREIIDFIQASSESQCAWEGFLHGLYQRGLKGQNLKGLLVDGGKGLEAALPLVYGQIPVQRCWAHKTRNVLNSVKRTDQQVVKKALHQISHAPHLRKAQQAAGHFVEQWQTRYPKATACLTKDLPELLTFLTMPVDLKPTVLRTTNAIERRFREVRRRTQPMGTFSDRTSIERILFAIFSNENQKEGVATPFLLLTQNS